mmetsp:Transcript_11900/g.23726  ORF Transcript_11900/g.23726 Transcript_11900/m.23726 type:complete len:212 (-) Transcript_11900:127-762(-)
MDQPYRGGIGSFPLLLMVVSFLQHRCREDAATNRKCSAYNLGALLLEFMELYGSDFNYITTGISIRNGGSYFPKGARDKREQFWQPSRPFSLALENPLEITADAGRNAFRIALLQKAFDVSYRVLLSCVTTPVIPAVSILETVLPPTRGMRRRADRAAADRGAGKQEAAGKRGSVPSPDGSDMEVESEEDDLTAEKLGQRRNVKPRRSVMV